MVERLLHRGLQNYGIVTANGDHFPIRLVSPIPNDLKHYTSEIAGLERHNHKIGDTWFSSNVANIMFICDNIPGTVAVSVET